MVVTQLNLEFRFQGQKLRGFSCELTRSPHGVSLETPLSTTCQVTVPILLSGLGMMAAGLVMNAVQVCAGRREGVCSDLGVGGGPWAPSVCAPKRHSDVPPQAWPVQPVCGSLAPVLTKMWTRAGPASDLSASVSPSVKWADGSTHLAESREPVPLSCGAGSLARPPLEQS